MPTRITDRYTPSDIAAIRRFLTEELTASDRGAERCKEAWTQSRVEFTYRNWQYWRNVSSGFRWALSHLPTTGESADGDESADEI